MRRVKIHTGNRAKFTLAAVILTLVGAFFLFDLNRYFSLEFLKGQHAALGDLYRSRPLLSAALYFLLYVTLTGLSLPVAAVLTLAGGAIFGLLWGTVLVSFASTIGATLAFLASRYLFHDPVQARFAGRLAAVNAGVARDGAWYLFMLRLVPVFPFFAVNLVMGLTPMRTMVFFLISQAGMLPATAIYVNAGTEIARISAPGDILSPRLIASLVLLGAFPLIAKKTVDLIRRRRNEARPSPP